MSENALFHRVKLIFSAGERHLNSDFRGSHLRDFNINRIRRYGEIRSLDNNGKDVIKLN